MSIFYKAVNFITDITKWLAYIITILMMFMISYFAITRSINNPVKGDIELVQFVMVLLIVTSLAYTERLNAHVVIDLIFSRLPKTVQTILTFISRMLVLFVCFVISWTFLSKIDPGTSSTVLNIPFYPFRVMIVIGFIAWGLEIIRKLLGGLNKSIKAGVDKEEL